MEQSAGAEHVQQAQTSKLEYTGSVAGGQSVPYWLLLRHLAAHRYLSAGGQETNLMRLMGWSSRSMVSRYAASAADDRAREEHRRLGLGDQY